MIIGKSRRWVGTLAAGALVLSGVSLAAVGPAGATTLAAPTVTAPAPTQVTQIRPDETSYLGWHNGAANTPTSFTVGWNGVRLGLGDSKTQIINGLVATGAPGLPTTAAELGILITGSTISVASGAVFAQVAFTTTGAWGTLRPAVPASTTTSAQLSDLWMSSQKVGTTVVANTPMPLSDLLAALGAQGDLKYSAFGYYAQTPSRVTGMTWNGETFAFGTTLTPIPVTSSIFVPKSSVRPNETSYAGWHEGYGRATAFSVEPDGLHVGIGQPSQIINGLVETGAAGLAVTPEKLATLITSSTISVASGEVFAQVAFTTAAGWGTLRPAVAATTSTPKLTDLWMSSKPVGSTVPADTAVPLVNLLTALGDQGNLRYSAFGLLALTPTLVTGMTWDGVAYSFVAAPTQTVLVSSPSSVFGTPVDYTATVTTAAAGGVAEGTIQFSANGEAVGGPVTLVDNKARFTWTAPVTGTTQVTAKFLGSASFLPSESSASHTVTVAPTTTTLLGAVAAEVGSDVVLTATVASGAGVPTGSVEFVVNDGTAQSVSLVDGAASFTAADVKPGVLKVAVHYSGDSTHGASSNLLNIPVAFPKATGTADEVYIQDVYRDLFGRNAEPAGLKAWTTLLATGTPRSAVANGITYSTEYRTGLISDIYARYLGRTPDAAGLAGWLRAMDGGATVAQIESGFFGSDEYYATSGGTDAALVGQMYADILGRTAAPSEVAAWVDRLSAGSSRPQVAMGFLLSTEHLTTVVDGYYVALLHRNIDPVGQAGWVSILQAGGRDEAIIAGIIASKEYYSQS